MVLYQLTSQNAQIGAPHYFQLLSILRLDRNRHCGGLFLHIRDDLSYSVTFIGLENMELPLHNGSSNCFVSVHCTVLLPLLTFHYFMWKDNASFYSDFVLICDFDL